MEELKAMFRVCVAIKKDGIRCNSPALKGGNFCFQHIGGSLREHTRARSIYNGPKLDFLYPGDRQSIQHNLYVVAQAMNDGNLELATANTYNRIFSTCERNLRRWEMQSQKPGPEPELAEVPEQAPESEAPRSEGGPFKRSLSGEHNPALSQATNVKPASEHGEPLTKNDVILSGATVGSEVEEPAFSPSSKDADGDPLKRSLSGEQNHAGSDTNLGASQIVIPTEVCEAGVPVNRSSFTGWEANEAEEPAPKNDVILSEVEEPAFSPSSKNAEGGPFKRSLSGEHNPAPSEAENVKQRNLSPEPCALSPESPLKLTPEEIQMFKDLETRYINDPTLADRIHDTYRQIRQRRRAAAEESSIPVPG